MIGPFVQGCHFVFIPRNDALLILIWLQNNWLFCLSENTKYFDLQSSTGLSDDEKGSKNRYF